MTVIRPADHPMPPKDYKLVHSKLAQRAKEKLGRLQAQQAHSEAKIRTWEAQQQVIAGLLDDSKTMGGMEEDESELLQDQIAAGETLTALTESLKQCIQERHDAQAMLEKHQARL